MRNIKYWPKGPGTCTGISNGVIGFEQWDGKEGTLCLVQALETDKEQEAIVGIIERLFPELACRCPHYQKQEYLGLRIVHFNNHPKTTRDMINKIVHTYHMEVE